MGTTMIPNITEAGNIKRADPLCQHLPTSISIPRGYNHPPQGCIIVIILPVVVQGTRAAGVIHTKKLLTPKLKPTLHNAFAILSQPDDPTNYNMSEPPMQMEDDNTSIPPDPREHRRQRKIARRQHIKQTLRCLRDSDNLFLENSITLAEDEWISLAKDDDSNKKRMAINDAHTKRGTTSIWPPSQM
jgi:hypothetical protein